MHPLFAKADGLTQQIIGGAIEVHKDKGPGLVESIYEWCLLRELELRRLTATNQRLVTISYKGFAREEPLRFDCWWRTASWLRPKPSSAFYRFTKRNFSVT